MSKFQVHLTNVHNSSPEFNTFDEAAAWARKACFEATIVDNSKKINFGSAVVAFFSPISGLRDMRPFAGRAE